MTHPSMKVLDCFIFYNELKLLKFRLAEHNDFVDIFIIVEATKTFSGKPKPLYFQENKHMFTEFLHKIIHIVVDDMPEYDAPNISWLREVHQRCAIQRGIQQVRPEDLDIILISDVDEIFDQKYVLALKELNQSFSAQMNFVTYYYDFEHRCDELDTAVRALTYDNYKRLECNPELIRMSYIFQKVENSGWHLSYFGDETFIQNKLANFAHQEYNNEADLNLTRIRDCLKNGTDVCHRYGYTIQYVPLEQSHNLPRNYTMML
jgi:hypothetical protein